MLAECIIDSMLTLEVLLSILNKNHLIKFFTFTFPYSIQTLFIFFKESCLIYLEKQNEIIC